MGTSVSSSTVPITDATVALVRALIMGDMVERSMLGNNGDTYMSTITISFMLLIFVLTDANEATYSIEFGSNFSL